MIILIPAYQPGKALVDLVDALAGSDGIDADVLVVDDGSGPAYDSVFAMVRARGVIVLSHLVNRGKGAALKTGFAYAARHHPGETVVCADSDGQHRPADIAAVAAEVERGSASIVLGARGFTGEVPLRSRFGNDITRTLFGMITGRRLRDTQTGLRAYPPKMLDWLGRVPGERFEYEQQVLLRAVEDRLPIAEVEIETVYLQANASSHFRPVRDSWAIYRPLLRQLPRRIGAFGLSSLAGWAVDVTVFAALTLLGLLPAVALVAARLLSATLNFTLNRHWVFARESPGLALPPLGPALAKYAALAAAYLGLNLLLLGTLINAGAWTVPAKVAVDAALFGASFWIQRRWWGRRTDPSVSRPAPSADTSLKRAIAP